MTCDRSPILFAVVCVSFSLDFLEHDEILQYFLVDFVIAVYTCLANVFNDSASESFSINRHTELECM